MQESKPKVQSFSSLSRGSGDSNMYRGKGTLESDMMPNRATCLGHETAAPILTVTTSLTPEGPPGGGAY